ncbi:MAG: ABC-2 family transporter protein [Armatimonadetes bacterium]|nr:ABC-2 family transporter protein [Armatimonadota bacterium]
MRYLYLILVFIRTSIQTEVEYRADFYTRALASLMELGTTVGALWVVFSHTQSLAGWSFAQVLVLLSIYYLMDGLIQTFIAPNMRQVMDQVRQGTLDFVLVKPENSQFLASFRTVNIWGAANVPVGLVLAFLSVRKLAGAVGFWEAGAFAVTLFSGLVIIYAFWLMLVTLTFWFIKIDNIDQIVWQAFSAGRYPVDIYPLWLRRTLTYAIPIAFILTVPARALTGQLAGQSVLISLLMAAVMLVLCSAFWRFGLKYYTGASS